MCQLIIKLSPNTLSIFASFRWPLWYKSSCSRAAPSSPTAAATWKASYRDVKKSGSRLRDCASCVHLVQATYHPSYWHSLCSTSTRTCFSSRRSWTRQTLRRSSPSSGRAQPRVYRTPYMSALRWVCFFGREIQINESERVIHTRSFLWNPLSIHILSMLSSLQGPKCHLISSWHSHMHFFNT